MRLAQNAIKSNQTKLITSCKIIIETKQCPNEFAISLNCCNNKSLLSNSLNLMDYLAKWLQYWTAFSKKESSKFSLAITFTFKLILLGKV